METLLAVKAGVIGTNIVANIVLNSIVIVVIARTPRLREDRTTLFVLSLASSDLAIGLSVMPISVVMCSCPGNLLGNLDYIPAIHGFFTIWLSMTSTHNVCWIGMCKMIAVVHPLRYLTLMTERRCYGVIVANWTFSLALSLFLFRFPLKWNSAVCMFQVRNKYFSLVVTLEKAI